MSLISRQSDNSMIKMRRDRNVWLIDACIEEDIEDIDEPFRRPE